MKSHVDLTAVEWPRANAARALRALSLAAGEQPRGGWGAHHATTEEVTGPGDRAAPDLAELVAASADASGLDADPIDLSASDPLSTVRRSAPMLVALPGREGVLAILRCRHTTATLVTPRGRVEVPVDWLEDALGAGSPRLAEGPPPREPPTSSLQPPAAPAAGVLLSSGLDLSFMPARRRRLALRTLLKSATEGLRAAEGWTVRRASSGLKDELGAAKVYRRIAAVLLGYLVQFALFVAIWREVGARAYDGGRSTVAGAGAGVVAGAGADQAAAAAAVTATQGRASAILFLGLLALWVVVQLLSSAAVSRLALDVGAVVRAALLRGALRLDPSRIRLAGVGQLLGRALDADVLDALALGGGVEAAAGLFELALGAMVLGLGVAPAVSLAALAAVLGGLGVLAWLQGRALSSWSDTRRALTHDLVERMVGHRTVLVQDRSELRSAADASALAVYEGHSRALDRTEVALEVLVPRSWLLLGLAALAPVALTSRAELGAPLALSIGGVWLVYGALRRFGTALPMLSLARQAWQQISPLVGQIEVDARGREAGKGGDVPPAAPAPSAGRAAERAPLLAVDHVSFRYPGRPAAVLNAVDVTVSAGDRVLVEGPSGGGKSTLAALLTGLKTPSSGALRLRGIDQRSLGLIRWRNAIAGAPQFHDNHVFGADFLFNVLMGRRWPPRMEDVTAAEQVCRDLGLGTLLERMPAGLQQQIGETGWQLSHGERSRLFIARSLLQSLDMRVLDESFAALDPETLDQVMGAVLIRPEALLVIAHP